MNDKMNEKFHLEINSFSDFVAFVSIIRGKELNPEEIAKLTESIKKSDDALSQAIAANKEK